MAVADRPAIPSSGGLGLALWGPRSVFLSWRTRLLLTAIAAVVGAATAALAMPFSAGASALLAWAALVTVPVAVAKSGTACGVNALRTFSRPAPTGLRLFDAALYAATSTVVATALGVGLSIVGSTLGLQAYLPLGGVLLGYLGLREFGYFASHPMVSPRWQVPSRWVARPRTAPIVWGAFLGTGLFTFMPHPTYYGLLVVACCAGFPAAPALLGLYGLVRAAPAFMAAVEPNWSGDRFAERSPHLRLAGHALSGFGAIAAGGAALVVSVVSLADGGESVTPLLGAELPFLVAVVLAGLFALSGSAKLVNPSAFRGVLIDTYAFEHRVAGPAARLVPLTELLIGGLLLMPNTRLWGFGLAGVFGCATAVVVAHALVTGRRGDCGCLGTLKPMGLRASTVVRSLLVGVVGLTSFLLSVSGPASGDQPTLELWGAALAVAAGAGVAAGVFIAGMGAVRAARGHR